MSPKLQPIKQIKKIRAAQLAKSKKLALKPTGDIKAKQREIARQKLENFEKKYGKEGSKVIRDFARKERQSEIKNIEKLIEKHSNSPVELGILLKKNNWNPLTVTKLLTKYKSPNYIVKILKKGKVDINIITKALKNIKVDFRSITAALKMNGAKPLTIAHALSKNGYGLIDIKEALKHIKVSTKRQISILEEISETKLAESKKRKKV